MKLFYLPVKRLSAFLLVSIVACSFIKKEDPHHRDLSLEQVREDFFDLTQKIESGVPNPYYYCSKQDYDSVKTSVLNKLKDGMTIQETFRVFYPLIQCLNDAHFSIHLPDEIIENENITYFPVRVIIDGDKLYALEDLSVLSQIKNGEEIYFINRIPVKEIIEKIKGTNDKRKNDQAFFEYRNEAAFHRRLYPLFGFKDSFEIKTADKTYLLNGISAKDMEVKPKPTYEFKILNAETGYLKVNSLVWETTKKRDSLKNLLESNFRILKEQSINKLIVDIRGNLGGSSVLAKDILDYFTDIPYTLSVGADYFYKGKAYYSATNELHTPLVSENKFKGKVLLISDVLTYSSAHMMQVGFKHYNMGITSGHQSSESLYITGEIKKTVLKNSGIELIAPTANFRLPGYSEAETKYYTPDYVLYPSLSERLSGNDVMLNKAIDILK